MVRGLLLLGRLLLGGEKVGGVDGHLGELGDVLLWAQHVGRGSDVHHGSRGVVGRARRAEKAARRRARGGHGASAGRARGSRGETAGGGRRPWRGAGRATAGARGGICDRWEK